MTTTRTKAKNAAAVALNAIHQARMADRAPGSKLPGLTEAGRDARRRNAEKARARLAEIREAARPTTGTNTAPRVQADRGFNSA